MIKKTKWPTLSHREKLIRKQRPKKAAKGKTNMGINSASITA